VKHLLRILIWAGLAVVVLVGLLEAVLWTFAPVGKRASQQFEFDNQLPGLKERVSYRVDEQSLRSWAPSQPADGAVGAGGREARVLVIGGGATVGLLQNDEDVWWGQLAAALQNDLPDTRLHVAAYFREYLTMLQAAKWAEQNLAAINPDVLVVMLGFEDVLSQSGAYTYTPNKLATLTIDPNPRRAWKEFLVNASQLCRRYVNRAQRRSVMAQLGPLGQRNAYAQRLALHRQIYAQLPLAYEVDRPEGRDPMREYLDGIQALAALSEQHGVALAVIGEPTLHRGLMDGGADRLVHRWFPLAPEKGDAGMVRLDSGWIELQLSRYYGEAEKLCATLGVPFLDPTRKLPAHPAVFVDDVMVTDSGAIALATVVQPVVKPLIEKRSPP